MDLELRKTYLGGTDLVAISFLSEYKKPGDVWLDKVKGSTFTGNNATEWGHDVEPIVAMRHGRRFGVDLMELPKDPVTNFSIPVYHPEFPFIAANVDRIYKARPCLLECKTAGEDQLYEKENPKWGEDMEPNKVPIGYFGQTNHYQGIMGYKDAFLSCMFLGKSRIQRDYPIEFDRELYDLMTQNGVTFWKTYVEPRIQPPVELFSPEVVMQAVALRARLEVKKAPPLEATPEVEAWALRYKELSNAITAGEEDKKILAARIAQWIADNQGTKVKHSLGSFTFKQPEAKAPVAETDFKAAFEQFLERTLAIVHPDAVVVDEIAALAEEVKAACRVKHEPKDAKGPTVHPWWAK